MAPSRRPLKTAAQEVDAGWQGPKCMVPYAQLTDPVRRLQACRAARGQATINEPTRRRLRAAEDAGAVAVLQGVSVAGAAPADARGPSGALRLALTPTATGQAAAPGTNADPGSHPRELEVDRVWLACGAACRPDQDPVLSALGSGLGGGTGDTGGLFVGGYPRCDDGSLVVPGAPAYVLGRPALLALGPTAGGEGHGPGQGVGWGSLSFQHTPLASPRAAHTRLACAARPRARRGTV